MIQIGDKIVSKDLFEHRFICHLERCEGNCCVFGDAGAPLEENEATDLEKYADQIKPFLRPEGKRAIQDQGCWVIDQDGEQVTPLVGREECAYAVFEMGIARCAIEWAYEQDVVPVRKPVSCHLYPIRVNQLKQGVALNYHQWSICEPARQLGAKEGMPVFRFLQDALIRVYGEDFYEEMELVYRELQLRIPEIKK
jgi:hypothetical protein